MACTVCFSQTLGPTFGMLYSRQLLKTSFRGNKPCKQKRSKSWSTVNAASGIRSKPSVCKWQEHLASLCLQYFDVFCKLLGMFRTFAWNPLQPWDLDLKPFCCRMPPYRSLASNNSNLSPTSCWLLTCVEKPLLGNVALNSAKPTPNTNNMYWLWLDMAVGRS